MLTRFIIICTMHLNLLIRLELVSMSYVINMDLFPGKSSSDLKYRVDMVKYALLVEYNGANFHGWQIQAGVPTIQGHLDFALSKFAGEPITTVVAGRTDAGVHALNQLVHFTSGAKRSLPSWVTGVNTLLPAAIRVKQACVVADDFDARFSAISRTYHYYLLTARVKPAILNGLVGWYHQKLDVIEMREAMQMLIGKHDFSSFRAANCQANVPVREMYSANLEVSGDLLRFSFTANAFLYHMIRNLVGALVYVGNARMSSLDFKQLMAVKNRSKAPPTFMPDGLYLVNIDYKEQLFAANDSQKLWIFN